MRGRLKMAQHTRGRRATGSAAAPRRSTVAEQRPRGIRTKEADTGEHDPDDHTVRIQNWIEMKPKLTGRFSLGGHSTDPDLEFYVTLENGVVTRYDVRRHKKVWPTKGEVEEGVCWVCEGGHCVRVQC
jgi:hypothetical protein